MRREKGGGKSQSGFFDATTRFSQVVEGRGEESKLSILTSFLAFLVADSTALGALATFAGGVGTAATGVAFFLDFLTGAGAGAASDEQRRTKRTKERGRGRESVSWFEG